MKPIQKHIDWLNTNTLTQEELAKKKGVSTRLIRYQAKSGKIKSYKVKNDTLYESE
jgi:predicted transcriptional regulator